MPVKNPAPAELSALRARAARIAGRLPGPARGPDGRLTPESRAQVEAAMRRILRKNRAVGASLVLVPPAGAPEEVFTAGFARLHPRVPVRAQTCFRVASVSKLVMTFGTLSLVASDQLALDADISDWLGYPVRSPHAPDVPVTPRMLLTHTAALRDEGSYGARGMEPGCTLRELLSDPQNWLPQPPGAAFHYSNLGAGVCGCVMERASQTPFDALMRERVFGPLGIRASYDPRRVDPSCDLADGYSVRPLLPPMRRYDASKLAARPPEPFDPERDYLIAAGRLITDSRGMAQLIRLLASRDGMGVIPGALLSLMRTPQDGLGGIANAGRGLNTAFLPGVFPGFNVLGHQGVAYGMCAELFSDPSRGCGVGVMTSGAYLMRTPPLMRVGVDLLSLGFAALC